MSSSIPYHTSDKIVRESDEPMMDIPSRPWASERMPRRILAIRLQAMGDVVISLPYLQQVRSSLPGLERFDLMTREEDAGIPDSLHLFDHIYPLGGGRKYKWQLINTFLLLPKLLMQRYDVVLDLQNNLISEIVRKTLMPKAWSVFDRFSPFPAGERYQMTIAAAGLGTNMADTRLQLKHPNIGFDILETQGWKKDEKLILLNPAGAFETRNWAEDNYASFAQLFLKYFPDSKFLVLGTGLIVAKAEALKRSLGDKLINLVGKTTPAQAFAVIQHASFALTEDSGLMHMCWVSGVPTLALFGGTRSDWSRPLGPHSALLDSSDLPCGNCMQEFCKYGDVHCLSRYTPEYVFEKAIALMERVTSSFSPMEFN